MNNPTVILNGDQVYCDELIRENARLTIQHEVDRQKMEALERQIEDQAANIASLEAHSYAREDLEELADLRRTMDKAIKELERLSPVNIVYQNEGVVGYDAEQRALVFPPAMLKQEVLARLPAEIVIATAEQCEPGIAQEPYMRKTAMAVSVEF